MVGSEAEVVPLADYPQHYHWLLQSLQRQGRDDVYLVDNYVALKWTNEPTCTQDNGIFAKYYFDVIG